MQWSERVIPSLQPKTRLKVLPTAPGGILMDCTASARHPSLEKTQLSMTESRLPQRHSSFFRGRCVLASLLACLAGCSGIEKAPPQSTSSRVSRSYELDVPEIMRGTVGSECILRGYQAITSPGYRPVIARGYGLVVGLRGTGSRQMPPQLRQYMLQEAARNGIGNVRYGETIGELTPEQLIDSPDTAVVVVEAVVPQGAPKGTQFDVRVSSVASSDTTSLEGGILWTTSLRPGQLSMGGRQAAQIAQARGPVFLNPFAESGVVGSDGINKTVGRILNGGETTEDMPMKLALANPSHARAEVLVTAINTRFPEEPGQMQNTARGESDELIEITVPPSWHDATEDFVKLLMHTTIAVGNPEGAAMFVKRTLLASPGANAEAASWRWQAMGPKALPIIKDLYDHPEELPRLAALRAGAKLDDGVVIPHLIDMAEQGSALNRLQAVDLLEGMRTNPSIDACLRKLLDDDDVELRLRAYEALVTRNDPFMDRFNVDGKFVLDVVKSDRPLIYITQVGEPRIAVFGDALELQRPLTLSTWANRLMIKGDVADREVEVYYRDTDEVEGVILRSKPAIPDFVRFLAHKTSIEEPEPGLNLTYGQTVGALHDIWMQKRIDSDFKLQQDRILAAIRRIQSEGEDVEARPELSQGSGNNAAAAPSSDIGRLSEAPVAMPANNPQNLPRADKSPAKNPGE